MIFLATTYAICVVIVLVAIARAPRREDLGDENEAALLKDAEQTRERSGSVPPPVSQRWDWSTQDWTQSL